MWDNASCGSGFEALKEKSRIDKKRYNNRQKGVHEQIQFRLSETIFS